VDVVIKGLRGLATGQLGDWVIGQPGDWAIGTEVPNCQIAQLPPDPAAAAAVS